MSKELLMYTTMAVRPTYGMPCQHTARAGRQSGSICLQLEPYVFHSSHTIFTLAGHE